MLRLTKDITFLIIQLSQQVGVDTNSYSPSIGD